MSMRILDGFKFRKLQTPIHDMDPRAKFLIIMCIFIASLLSSNIIVLLAIFLIQIPLVMISKLFKRWIASMRAGLFLTILIFLTNFVTGATFTLSTAMAIRFLALLSSFSIFFMTTSPDDLGLALERARVPYALCFTFTTAVRLVPTMAVDAQMVVDAQKSRGLELEKGSFMKKIRNYIPILIPLIICAIRRSIELAEALESRAFGAANKRTPVMTLKMKPSDYAVIVLTLASLAFLTYLNLYVKLPEIDIPIRMPLIWSTAALSV